MTKEEWNELVKGICNQKIKPKLRKIHRKYHPFEWFENFPFRDRGIYKASRTIKFIDENFDDEDDLTNVFNKEYLDNTLDNLRRGVVHNNRLVVKTGISDVVEEFWDEIVDGMEISDIPEADFEALREAGSYDPKSEIHVSMVRIKKRKKSIRCNSKESSLRYSLEKSESIIERKKEVLKECNSNNPPTKRKILKGLGGICRGAILTGVDIGLLAGFWPVPLSPDTTTVGAVASITTGIGDIMIAVGELRGE
jgi:hypothetical protein